MSTEEMLEKLKTLIVDINTDRRVPREYRDAAGEILAEARF